jgi:hypothetical protein
VGLTFHQTHIALGFNNELNPSTLDLVRNQTYALFISRKPNSRNSFFSFFNVWQPSENLVKGKLIPVNKKKLILPAGKCFPFLVKRETLSYLY